MIQLSVENIFPVVSHAEQVCSFRAVWNSFRIGHYLPVENAVWYQRLLHRHWLKMVKIK